MDCVVCHQPSGYNRVVVDAESGSELGGLCVHCETEAFGRISDELGEPGQRSCVCCERDGHWLLPKWLPSTYVEDGKTISYVDYDTAEAALRLCDEHLASIGVEDFSWRTDADGPEYATGRAED